MDYNGAVMAQAPLGLQLDGCDAKEERMTLKRHKELTALAYAVKEFIDKYGGIKGHEMCGFGQIMQSIGQLK